MSGGFLTSVTRTEELAAGQSIRQGSIGVWKHISPRLAGIGFASCVVCFFVALYYNVIIGWSLFYIFHSFQYPLPWESCSTAANQTEEVWECVRSSPATYFWYRKALNITDWIEESGGLNGALVGCLFLAWVVVCFSMIRGIKSSGKVMYFSSIFPYVVLLCFLIRGLLLEGAVDGIRIMFTPKLEIWKDIQVWRQAATQVFFALGLGFGSIIAYSSYNSRTNNCHFDAILVSFINFMTSILATLVVFAVLGFRANIITQQCINETMMVLKSLIDGGKLSADFLPAKNLSTTDYSLWYQQMDVNGILRKHKIEDCRVENEMNKGVEGTGLAFITFTEAMTLFPASPFWSVLFFFMLQNLGLSTMLGNMQGIITPLLDNFTALRKRKVLFTVVCCIFGFLFGLVFVQRSGNYFVTMFDDYSATLPLIIVVIFENVAVAWIYGADRFMDDIEEMLGWRPWLIYKYLWKYISLLAMLTLLLASLIRMCIAHPTYRAWNMEEAVEMYLEYPPWALALLIGLIIVASLPIPVLFFKQVLKERWQGKSMDTFSQCSYHRGDTADHICMQESPADPQGQANGSASADTEELAEKGKLLAEDSGEEVEEDKGSLCG
ncbi:sodium-dependent neutral amino acid transporter B(0)AT2 isoform X2 [Microcaecilia unicolor]|uniref:Sodium-dependent neutral amino acid transporter B(0)AT2-like isoform X2 n=1 Tax=Microcaecilia unicolor TaxID=1415580 RepID=A0A6P7XMR2_9AMPH|nr:sodium-dependent neutral amino acid transporter B(0)AT2-like isoform X2 [Microcaecilia unicolor]